MKVIRNPQNSQVQTVYELFCLGLGNQSLKKNLALNTQLKAGQLQKYVSFIRKLEYDIVSEVTFFFSKKL